MKVYALIRWKSNGEYPHTATLQTTDIFDSGEFCPIFKDKADALRCKKKLDKYDTKIIELEIK